MDAAAYADFTRRLAATLAGRPEVLGLVALGSTAGLDTRPDAWSDHDVWIVTDPGHAESYRRSLDWLPDAERIVLSLRETAHGVKLLYEDGHLVEFAAFDTDELAVARLNRYRILHDRGGLDERLMELRDTPGAPAPVMPATDRIAQILTLLQVGVSRYRRGEHLSARAFIHTHAMNHLVALIAQTHPDARPDLADDLDPLRRFEVRFPDIAPLLDRIGAQEAPEAATAMIDFLEREWAPQMPGFPHRAVAAVRGRLRT